MKTRLRRLLSIASLTLLTISSAFAQPSSSLSHSAPDEHRRAEVQGTLPPPSLGNGPRQSTRSLPPPSGWPPDAQSTTGPVPPPGIERGAPGMEALAAAVLLDVPAYIWHHGCGPTAAGMVMGYWDSNGFDNLIPGNADTQTPQVDAMISSSGNYEDYCLPRDYWPGPIFPDRSEPPVGDEHRDNCVADLMKTSQSFHSNYYGWSWFSQVDDAMQGYVETVAPEYPATAQNQIWGSFTWSTYRSEIDAGRPVVLLVDTNQDGSTDHFVTGIGYSDQSGTPMYACHDTWGAGVHWFEFAPMANDQPWGIYGATLFQIETPQCSDPHEPNDTSGQATPISYGSTLTDPDICPEADVDYYSFLGSAGDTIVADIDAQNIGSVLDSYLYLYDTDGVTELAENDDHDGLDSRIEYALPTDGTYYLKVREYDHPNEGGPGYFYAISLWRWTHRIFLPLVAKNYTEPGGVVNGDFEAGSTGWLEYSTHGWPLIVDSLPITPHSGGCAAWLGGDYDDISRIQQEITVPVSSPYLAYWHWIASQDTCGYDFGSVIINASVVDVYALCEATNTGGWVKHVVNLNAYAGQSVSLQIRAETNSSLNSSLFADDVSFQATASPLQECSTLFDLQRALPKSVEITPQGAREASTGAAKVFHLER